MTCRRGCSEGLSTNAGSEVHQTARKGSTALVSWLAESLHSGVSLWWQKQGSGTGN